MKTLEGVRTVQTRRGGIRRNIRGLRVGTQATEGGDGRGLQRRRNRKMNPLWRRSGEPVRGGGVGILDGYSCAVWGQRRRDDGSRHGVSLRRGRRRVVGGRECFASRGGGRGEAESVSRARPQRTVHRGTTWGGCRCVRSGSCRRAIRGLGTTVRFHTFCSPRTLLPFASDSVDIQTPTNTMRGRPSSCSVGRRGRTTRVPSGCGQKITSRLRARARKSSTTRGGTFEQSLLIGKLTRL